MARDAPGAGTSSDRSDPFTAADYARCLAGLLDTMEVGPPHVVGQSWGGILAQEVYRRCPPSYAGQVPPGPPRA